MSAKASLLPLVAPPTCQCLVVFQSGAEKHVSLADLQTLQPITGLTDQCVEQQQGVEQPELGIEQTFVQAG